MSFTFSIFSEYYSCNIIRGFYFLAYANYRCQNSMCCNIWKLNTTWVIVIWRSVRFFLQRTHSLDTTSLFDTLDPVPKIYEPKERQNKEKAGSRFTEGKSHEKDLQSNYISSKRLAKLLRLFISFYKSWMSLYWIKELLARPWENS